MAKITAQNDVVVGRSVGEPNERTGVQPVESVTLKPGDEVPEWAADQVPEELTREEQPEVAPDQVYDELLKEAVSNRLPVQDDWTRDQLAAAIRYHRELAARGESPDWETFSATFETTNEAGNVNSPGSGQPSGADRSELRERYKDLYGKNAPGAMSDETLAARVAEAEAKKAEGGTQS